MNFLKNPTTNVILLIAVVLLFFSNLRSCSNRKELEHEQEELIAALADTVQHFTNKQGEQVAQIQTLRDERAKDFVKLKTKDEEIIQLQQRVKEYQKKLSKPGSSVTNTKTETQIDTTIKTEPEPVIIVRSDTAYPVYKSSLKNKWVDISIRADVDSTDFKLKTYDEYSTIVGYDKKKKKWFTDVISSSPYTSVKTTRTFQTKLPKPKKWAIGAVAAYGVNKTFQPDFFFGVGVMKTFLRL